MSRVCKECGALLDEIPREECATHRRKLWEAEELQLKLLAIRPGYREEEFGDSLLDFTDVSDIY